MTETEALDFLATHQPVLGVLAGRAIIVGCACLADRDYWDAGHRPGQDGWRSHVAKALTARFVFPKAMARHLGLRKV